MKRICEYGTASNDSLYFNSLLLHLSEPQENGFPHPSFETSQYAQWRAWGESRILEGIGLYS